MATRLAEEALRQLAASTAAHRDQAVLSSKNLESGINLKSVKKVDGHKPKH